MGQVTVLTGPERRRRWSPAEREAILAEAFSPGGVVADVARRFDVSTSVIYRWRKGCQSNAPVAFSRVLLTGPTRRQETGPNSAILVELGPVRVSISSSAPAGLVTATLRTLK
jgi:transposase